MKTKLNLRLVRAILGLSLILAAFAADAQSYSISSFTIDGGGGGVSSNPQPSTLNYQLSGTIGQPDAGPAMTNGQFSVVGGFWVLPQAVQAEGAPTLTITPAAPGYYTISWTPATPGFVLQETWSLSTPNWTNSLSGLTNPVTLPAIGEAKSFRLRKP